MMAPASKEEAEVRPAISAEQAADLAALEAAAGAQAEAAAVAQAQEVQTTAGKLAGEISGLLTAAVAMAGPLFPSIVPLYTPQTIGAASNAVAAVCVKHGWMAGGFAGQWAEEIAAAVVVLPLAYATVQAVKADLAARAQATEKPAAGAVAVAVPAEVVASKTVTIGGVVAA